MVYTEAYLGMADTMHRNFMQFRNVWIMSKWAAKDNHTHNYATEVFHGFPSHRYHLVNLDMDPKDMMRTFVSADFIGFGLRNSRKCTLN